MPTYFLKKRTEKNRGKWLVSTMSNSSMRPAYKSEFQKIITSNLPKKYSKRNKFQISKGQFWLSCDQRSFMFTRQNREHDHALWDKKKI